MHVEFAPGQFMKPRVNAADGEMRQMQDQKGEHNEPAQNHGCFGRLERSGRPILISLRFRAPVFDRELDGRHNVKDQADNEKNADHPEWPGQTMKECRVGVDLFRPGKDLQIAGHVPDHISDQHKASERDDPFFANGRVVKRSDEVHVKS